MEEELTPVRLSVGYGDGWLAKQVWEEIEENVLKNSKAYHIL